MAALSRPATALAVAPTRYVVTYGFPASADGLCPYGPGVTVMDRG